MSELLLPFQAIVNRALEYDAVSREKVKALGDKCIVFSVKELPLSLSLFIEPDGFVVLEAAAPSHYNARVSGKAKDLIAVLQAEDRNDAMINHPIDIEGDTRTFFMMQDILAHLDVDWEMALGDRIGDLPAHLIADASRFFHQLFKNQINSLQRTRENIKAEGIQLPFAEVAEKAAAKAAQRARKDLRQLFSKLNRAGQGR